MLMNPSDETVHTRVVDNRPEDSGSAISSVCTAFTLYWASDVGEEKFHQVLTDLCVPSSLH